MGTGDASSADVRAARMQVIKAPARADMVQVETLHMVVTELRAERAQMRSKVCWSVSWG